MLKFVVRTLILVIESSDSLFVMGLKTRNKFWLITFIDVSFSSHFVSELSSSNHLYQNAWDCSCSEETCEYFMDKLETHFSDHMRPDVCLDGELYGYKHCSWVM